MVSFENFLIESFNERENPSDAEIMLSDALHKETVDFSKTLDKKTLKKFNQLMDNKIAMDNIEKMELVKFVLNFLKSIKF